MNIDEKIYRSTIILTEQIEKWKSKNANIVFTNGVFDLVHKGHVHYLNEASKLGDKLVVGINSDTSTSQIKGKHRPINNEESRMSIIASMGFVDAVILFNETTPLSLIQKITPHVLVKGGDYKIENIVGADHTLNSGGIVKVLHFIDGYSSTNIINKIRTNG